MVGSRGLNMRVVSDPIILVPLLPALWQLIDDIGYLSIFEVSSFDLLLFYVKFY